MTLNGQGAIKKLQKKQKHCVIQFTLFYCAHLKSFSLSHTPSVTIASSPQSCTPSESKHFYWLDASHVTRLPIHTFQTSPVSEQLCGEGSVSQTRRLQSNPPQ